MKRHLLTAVCTLFLALTAHIAQASVFTGFVLDPLEGESGNWQLFAVDDGADSFGLSTYNFTLTGVTSTRHMSPSVRGLQGADGESYDGGFSLLRDVETNSTSTTLHAAQPLPGMSPYLLSGLGQRTGDFASVASAVTLQPFAPVRNATSPAWGDYGTISPLNGNNWLLIAEGTYGAGSLPSISEATFTVYNNATTFSSSLAKSYIIPDPITPSLLTPDYLSVLTTPPPPPPVVETPVVSPPPVPPLVNEPTPPPADHDPNSPVVPPTIFPVSPEVPPIVEPSDPGSGQPEIPVIFFEDPNQLIHFTTFPVYGEDWPFGSLPIIDVTATPWWNFDLTDGSDGWHLLNNASDVDGVYTGWHVNVYSSLADDGLLIPTTLGDSSRAQLTMAFASGSFVRAATADSTAAPEPTAAILSAIGLASLAAFAGRRR